MHLKSFQPFEHKFPFKEPHDHKLATDLLQQLFFAEKTAFSLILL